MDGKITNHLLSRDDRSEAGPLPEYRADIVRDVLNALDDPEIVGFPITDNASMAKRLRPMVKAMKRVAHTNPTFGPDSLWFDDADFCALCVMVAASALRYVEAVYQTRDEAVAAVEAKDGAK